jgi:uroporphyrinogen-III synthase
MTSASAHAAARDRGGGRSAGAALTGLRVAITRSPDQAAPLAAALRAAGAEPVLVPLVDFESAPDQGALAAALGRLADGSYDWLVITSSTTVRALQRYCDDAGLVPTDLVPPGTAIAAVGSATHAALAAGGLHVDLIPNPDQSAAGLADAWPSGPARVLLPQSDLAAPLLREELAAKGASVETVTAYRTVDYPARPAVALGPAQPHPADADWTMLEPPQAATQIAAGSIHSVIAASGSAARAIDRVLAPLPASCLLIAIGESTRTAAETAGLSVAATAASPTTAGLLDALHRAVASPGRAARAPLPPAVRTKEHS